MRKLLRNFIPRILILHCAHLASQHMPFTRASPFSFHMDTMWLPIWIWVNRNLSSLWSRVHWLLLDKYKPYWMEKWADRQVEKLEQNNIGGSDVKLSDSHHKLGNLVKGLDHFDPLSFSLNSIPSCIPLSMLSKAFNTWSMNGESELTIVSENRLSKKSTNIVDCFRKWIFFWQNLTCTPYCGRCLIPNSGHLLHWVFCA